MLYKLVLPKADSAEGEPLRILEWHVTPGQRVEPGDLVVELESSKAIVEFRAEASAFLRTRLKDEGEWIDPGDVYGVFSDDLDESVPESVQSLAELSVSFAET